jgi:hypothetical protein
MADGVYIDQCLNDKGKCMFKEPDLSISHSLDDEALMDEQSRHCKAQLMLRGEIPPEGR